MLALSVKQPWAWLICKGFKDIESRSWPTKFRGRIYVHTGKRPDIDGWAIGNVRPPEKEYLAFGAIIGEVDITDCKFRFGEENDNLYSKWHVRGRYGFVLANPVLYTKPIPLRGQLRFFNVVLA